MAAQLIQFDDRLFWAPLPSPVPLAATLNGSAANRRHPATTANGEHPSSPPPSGESESDDSDAMETDTDGVTTTGNSGATSVSGGDGGVSSSVEDVERALRAAGARKGKQRELFWFSVDDELVYQSFASDFGPLNISMVYRFCLYVHELLHDPARAHCSLVLFCSNDPKPKANAALIMALYILIVQRKTPSEAFHPIADIEFRPFRDAGRGRGDFDLSIQDCLFGVYKALKLGLLNLEEFDLEEYCFYERVENGDFNWVSKDFIAFASPQDNQYVRSLSNPKATSAFPAKKLPKAYINVLEYFQANRVQLVIRLNNPLYDQRDFESRGIEFKDMFFEDGTNPPKEMVRAFLADAERVISAGGVIAIHCKAGLGRTGCLIAAWLIYKHGFTAGEAIGYMRICRPGMVVGPQQQYILTNHLEWVKWAGADEALAAYKAELATAASAACAAVSSSFPSTSSASRHVTPPAETRSISRVDPSVPAVTPARHVASLNAATNAISPVGQPRKTPLAKRSNRDVDSDDLDDDPLGRSPPHKYQRAKSEDPIPMLSAGRLPTRSTAQQQLQMLTSPAKASRPGAASSSRKLAPPTTAATTSKRAAGAVTPLAGSRIAISTRRMAQQPATESKLVRGPAGGSSSRRGPPSPSPILSSRTKAAIAPVPLRPFGSGAVNVWAAGRSQQHNHATSAAAAGVPPLSPAKAAGAKLAGILTRAEVSRLQLESQKAGVSGVGVGVRTRGLRRRRSSLSTTDVDR